MRIETIKREVRGIVLALLLVAATTVIVDSLVTYLGIRRGSVIYLLAVLVAGWRFGLLPALAAAVAGVLASGVLFYTPNTQRSEFLDLALFMIVALVASHVANSMKRQTEIARKREKEMSDLYAFSRRLAAAPSAADIYRAIEDHLTTHAQRKVVLFGAGAPDAVAKPSGDASVPAQVRSAIADVQRGHSVEANVTDDTGNVWHVRRVSQKTPDFGVIAIDLGRVPADEAADVHQRVNDMLADAADTLERLDVAHALDQAKMRSETELLREALIGSVSHELRTPLASILGAATVLSQSPAVANDERLNSLASVVRDEAERLNNDIQNLLDATRISREQIKPRMEWIEPSDIVNSALERRRRRLMGHTVSLDVDFEPAVHLCGSGADRAGLRAARRQCGQIFSRRLHRHGVGQAQRPRPGALGARHRGRPDRGRKRPARRPVLPRRPPCLDHLRLGAWPVDRQSLRQRQRRPHRGRQPRRQSRNHDRHQASGGTQRAATGDRSR